MTIETKLEKKGSQAKITGSIPEADLLKYRTKALAHLGKDAKLPGFRKGKVPEDVLISRMGEVAILEEATKEALGDNYGEILQKHSLLTIGLPAIQITKLVPGSPVEFSFIVDLRPELTLPDYKKVAKDAGEKALLGESTDVTEKDMTDTITRILESRAEGDGAEKKTPELTDEFVKTLGDFSSTEDFKEKLKENIKKDKEARLAQKKRASIVEAIVEKTTGDIPETIILHELERMMEQFKGDVSRMGLKFAEYLSHIKKNEDDLKKDWREDAKKRAISQIALIDIARKENISNAPDEIEKELNHLLEHHKDADRASAKEYVETVLTNEKVLSFLEKQG